MTDLNLRLSPNQELGRSVREEIRNWAGQEHLTDESCGNVIFVASELFSNAVAAAQRGTDIEVRLKHVGNTIQVLVINTGLAFNPGPMSMPPPTDVRGRGIPIAALLGQLTVSCVSGQTEVSVVLGD